MRGFGSPGFWAGNRWKFWDDERKGMDLDMKARLLAIAADVKASWSKDDETGSTDRHFQSAVERGYHMGWADGTAEPGPRGQIYGWLKNRRNRRKGDRRQPGHDRRKKGTP